jgi:hypothetical protein
MPEGPQRHRSTANDEKEPDVQTRKIGSLEVSAVGLGTNNFGQRIDDATGSSSRRSLG